jgi:hypothetical protein
VSRGISYNRRRDAIDTPTKARQDNAAQMWHALTVDEVVK